MYSCTCAQCVVSYLKNAIFHLLFYSYHCQSLEERDISSKARLVHWWKEQDGIYFVKTEREKLEALVPVKYATLWECLK